MDTLTETSLDDEILARNQEQVRTEDEARQRRLALRPPRAHGRRRLASTLWWMWPTCWAVVLTTAYFSTETVRDQLSLVLGSAGF